MHLNIAGYKIDMSKYALTAPVLLLAGTLVLADCIPQAKVTTSQTARTVAANTPANPRISVMFSFVNLCGISLTPGGASR